jgi:hypothetical protein
LIHAHKNIASCWHLRDGMAIRGNCQENGLVPKHDPEVSEHGKLLKKRPDLLAIKLTFDDGRLSPISTVNLKDVLCQIKADACKVHFGLFPSLDWLMTLPVWHMDAVRREESIPLATADFEPLTILGPQCGGYLPFSALRSLRVPARLCQRLSLFHCSQNARQPALRGPQVLQGSAC